MEKPLNLLLDEEINKLRAGIVKLVNESKLPSAVTKYVIENTAKDIVYAVNKQIVEESENYNNTVEEA